MSILRKTTILLGDLLILYLSLVLMLIFRYGLGDLSIRLEDHFLPFTIIFFLWLLIFYLGDFYHQKALNSKKIPKSLGVAVSFAILSSIIIFYLFGSFFELTPKTNLFIFGVIFFFLDWLFRLLVFRFFTSGGALGIAVLGNSPLVLETTNYLKEVPQAGFKTALWLKDVNPEAVEKIAEAIKKQEVQLVVVIDPHLTEEVTNKLIRLLSLEANFIDFYDFYELIFQKVPLEELKESWFIKNITARRPIYDFLKRVLDLALSLLIGVLLLPIGIIIAFVVKINSRGPAIYPQERYGKNGRSIMIYKFRTMAHENKGPLWTESNDNRITSFGKILRFTHLDEMPQLWNIFKGDISFTGPRPERIELAEKFKKFPYYEMRHIIKPGLSGWAQINYKPSASLEEGYEKLRYDIFYVKNRSFFLDLVIIIKTIKYVFSSYNR